MFLSVTALVIFIQLPNSISSLDIRACNPNSQFILNGFLCICNGGQWNEARCNMIGRRSSCNPGEIVKRGCTLCICQNDTKFICDHSLCLENVKKLPDLQDLSKYGPKCTPFRSYYFNCTICTCPASGKTSEAKCAVDASCPLVVQSSDFMRVSRHNYCLPNVMYLFPCLQCLCSENGRFISNKCTDICHKTSPKPSRRCIPGRIYRLDCNICKCPKNGISDRNLCRKIKCNKKTLKPILRSLKDITNLCTPHVFTNPKCYYCDCNPEGTVNKKSCLRLNCSKLYRLQDHSREICSPGEVVPICMECFCLSNGTINIKYCTKFCSNQHKLDILENVLYDNSNKSFLDESKVTAVERNDKCLPNSIYVDHGRYCLCPKDPKGGLKFCTSFYKDSETPTLPLLNYDADIDVNANCKPSTLVDFGCNTCFCSKQGKINLKWCTHDDCEAKKAVQETHRVKANMKREESKNTCTPGTISTVKCNFCICPDSGILKERVCTKNECDDTEPIPFYDELACEPLAYYKVDCNICYCPHDGLKNVAKCTKNPCETNFLRSDSCIPSHLFTDGCNVCVCPINGDKGDKACTNHSCGTTWNMFKLPQTMMGNEISKRSLEVCFRGEEFVEGCKLCVCTDVGLKAYATCESVLCDERAVRIANTTLELEEKETALRFLDYTPVLERRDLHEPCFIYNTSDVAERKECTPGSMYFIRCRQCICPYAGNINNFCRPLPKNVYCEQPFPGFNYLPMGRRACHMQLRRQFNIERNSPLQYSLTNYKCGASRMIIDECYICECDQNFLIQEHCYSSDSAECVNATPTFINDNKAIVI